MVKIFKPGSRTLAALVAAAALVPALMITSGGTASASDGDPVATGCAADAYTVSSQPVTDNTHIIGRVDLRYSPRCQTNWARGISYIGNASIEADVVGPTDTARYSAYATSVYTDMVYSPNGTCAAAWAVINGYSSLDTWGC